MQIAISWENFGVSEVRFRDANNVEFIYTVVSEPAFTCPKLTRETLEQGVKYVQS